MDKKENTSITSKTRQIEKLFEIFRILKSFTHQVS